MQKSVDKNDPDKKALSSYGLWCPELQQMFLRFVEERPVSDITCEFLSWSCQRLKGLGKSVLALVWENASWHISEKVCQWIRDHNTMVKRCGGVRILVCRLPVKSPWLNPIEPKWVHAKRAIVEPERVLTAQEIRERVCEYFDSEQLELLNRSIAQQIS
ncbi:MAG: transposase [Chroococcidiopsidaceae cyanobacterium CP_BM_RX_35]|nr:transposase [Chroococcidiopsidaceae cyanobacterium CP_BM_RX_35]